MSGCPKEAVGCGGALYVTVPGSTLARVPGSQGTLCLQVTIFLLKSVERSVLCIIIIW